MTRIAMLLAVLASGCFTGRPDRWTANHTRNVTVYTDAWVEHRYMQEWLERSYNAYRAFFPGIDPGKVDAVWLKVQPGWYKRFHSPFDDPKAGWTLETVPSGSRIGRNGLIVLERREELTGGRRLATLSVRDHTMAKVTMAHLFVKAAVPNAPVWLQVGLGKYMSKYHVQYRGDFYRACFGSSWFDEPILPIASAGRFAGDGTRVLIPLDELFAADWYEYDRRLRHWYEFTAYSLVHYLIHGEGGFNKTRFATFLRALRDGQTTDEALALGYPHVLPDEWEDKLNGHVRPPRQRFSRYHRLGTALCLRIPPERDADFKPRRESADRREIQVLMDDLERVEPFRRHGGWMPADVIAAEAMKRPGKGRRGDQPAGGEKGEPVEDSSTPTLRAPAPVSSPP